MPKTGKKYKKAATKVDRTKRYTLADACKLLPETKVAKFDESVDIAVRLGVDPKHADQMVRGAVVLPHGTGKTLRVAVIAKGDKAKDAQDAGADFVGAEDLVEKIQKENWTDFDSMVATPDMMGLVGRLGRVLGPKGLMPNPKVGTVTTDVAKAVRELKAGRRVSRREGWRGSRENRQSLLWRRQASRERACHGRDADQDETGLGKRHVHEVGYPFHHDGSGDQG